ncbi:MAG: hypothetical protein C4308_15210 [Chitinophagaceae bacterium]
MFRNGKLKHIALSVCERTILGLFAAFICMLATNCHFFTNTQEQSLDNMVVEIKVRAEGVVSPPGETLMFRLFRSGLAEFDVHNLTGERKNEMQRKSIQVDESDILEIGRLLRELEISLHKREYPPNVPMTDVRTTTTLTYKSSTGQNLTIILYENDSAIDFTAKQKYPESMRKLFIKIGNMRGGN